MFNIVDLSLTYNGIIERPILYKIDAATSIRRLSMKIPLEDRVITILEDQTMAQQCYQLATKPSLETFPLASLEVKKQGANLEPVDQVQTLQISGEKVSGWDQKLS